MKPDSVLRFLLLLLAVVIISPSGNTAEVPILFSPGNYIGFLPGPQPDVLLGVRLRKSGVFTGQILKITSQDGIESEQSVRFSGKLDSVGAATVQPNSGIWTDVRLQYATNSSMLTVYFTFSGIEYGPYSLVQTPFSKQNPATAFAGRYTIAARCETDFDSQAGYGYFTALVTPTGSFRLSGRLPDGKAFATSRPVMAEGNVPLWNSLYNGGGHVAGVLNLSWLGGHVGWGKPGSTSEPGLAIMLDTAISKFTPPGNGRPTLPLNDAYFSVRSAEPELARTNAVLMSGDKLVNSSHTVFGWKLNRNTGAFSGKIQEAHSFRKVSFAGVVMQNRSAALGRCNNGTALSAVTLEPPFQFEVAVGGQALATFPMTFSLSVEGDACCPSWSFSDGAYATGNVVGHVFGQPGTYQVIGTLYTVSHPEGISKMVQVAIEPPP